MGRKRHPVIFQGNLTAKSYFEGWYFKLVDPSEQFVYAIIPGIALDKKTGTSHAFIQILNGKTADYEYLQFPLTDFEASRTQFDIQIGNNSFSDTHLTVNIDRPEIKLRGELNFTKIIPFPTSFLRPNVMGPFTYLPFMECYHGLVNLSSKIEGVLTINGQTIDFSGGKGYIEKDYGTSFPDNWIWMQSNHFSEDDTTFFFSLAKIPYLGLKFPGFLCVFTYRERKMVLATYNGAKITQLTISPENVNIQIENSKFCLKIYAKKTNWVRKDGVGAIMRAPKNGQMTSKCIETISAIIDLRFYQKKSRKSSGSYEWMEIMHDTGKNAGLEIMADHTTFPKLTSQKKKEKIKKSNAQLR
ncbi:MAG: hypothetical protein KAR20_01540 [Candidatus Heimdallarchaeota archaeon]|nr:hypothetical protein [Candidatus Heimdallarchaeota archaeon]